MTGNPDLGGSRRAEELAGLGSWELELATGAVVVRPGIRALIGWAADTPDPILEDYFRAVHPEDRSPLTARWEALLASGQEYVDEHRLVLPDGTLKYVRAVAAVERGEDGVPVRVFGITHDITDLQVVSRNYQRERDLSRAILNSLQEGYLLTRDAVIVEVNGAFCALTGYSAAELVGTSQPFPFWADDGPTSLPELIRRLRTEGGGRADVKLRHRDGGTLDAHVTSTPLADDALASGMWLSVFRDISEQRRYERLLLSRAQTDPLTGLQNSRTFRDRLRQAADRASAAEPLSLALLDLDHFKRINDTHGHAVGDEVLCAVVERVVEVTGEQYPWARIGGEEFALLMPETPLPAARRLVDAALSALRRSPLPAVGAVTASAGVAELTRPADDDRLFRQADALLYQAKAAGRDQLCSQV